MIITANDLNNIEQTITNNYYQDTIYTITSTSGTSLNCSYNQIKAQIDAGKIVQIKFNNISASNSNITYWVDTGNGNWEERYETVTGTGITYDYVLGLSITSGTYMAYLPKYGTYTSSSATGILTAASLVIPE